MTIAFPGGVLRRGSENPDVVMALQRRLNELRVGPLAVDGHFGQATEAAVRLFQARSADSDGRALVVDGEVGALTWHAIFADGQQGGPPSVSVSASSLSLAALAVAEGEVGTMEVPPGSNRGPRVDQYIRATGLDPADGPPWCVCFIYWCFQKAAVDLGQPNPLPKTASVLDLWDKSARFARLRLASGEASAAPESVRPGMIFFIDTGGGKGHAGLVASCSGRSLVTVEGNTNGGGSREGVGVFRRTSRSIDSINLGFALY